MKTGTFNGLKFIYREHTCDEQQLAINPIPLFVPEYHHGIEDVIIDVGAHIGAFALHAALKAPLGKVYAIEPSKKSFELLQMNKSLNGLENVVACNLALYDRKGFARLSHYPEHPSFGGQSWGNTLTLTFHEGEIVRTDTLANFLEDNKILKCNYMKVNCEGSEFEIILSTPKEHLRRTYLYLVLYHCDMNWNHKPEELAEHFKENGFEVDLRKKEHERGWIVARKN